MHSTTKAFCVSLCPGFVLTNIFHNQTVINIVGSLVAKTPYQGAQTILYLALSPNVTKENCSTFYSNSPPAKTNKIVDD